jgi:hypothetical protein
MSARAPRLARIKSIIPLNRVDLTSGDRVSVPAIGDIVELDQGFTGPNSQPMGIVHCRDAAGTIRWVADVMDSELELLGPDEVV